MDLSWFQKRFEFCATTKIVVHFIVTIKVIVLNAFGKYKIVTYWKELSNCSIAWRISMNLNCKL